MKKKPLFSHGGQELEWLQERVEELEDSLRIRAEQHEQARKVMRGLQELIDSLMQRCDHYRTVIEEHECVPTQDAYDRVCQALSKSKARVEELERGGGVMGKCHKHQVYWNDRKAVTGECYRCVIEERDALKEDRDRLDFMQALLDLGEYTGECVLRMSQTGRGFRLHETSSHKPSFKSIRKAIDYFMGVDEHKQKGGK